MLESTDIALGGEEEQHPHIPTVCLCWCSASPNNGSLKYQFLSSVNELLRLITLQTRHRTKTPRHSGYLRLLLFPPEPGAWPAPCLCRSGRAEERLENAVSLATAERTIVRSSSVS